MSQTTSTQPLVREQNLTEAIINSKNVPVLASQFDIFTGKGTDKRLFSLDNNQAGIYAELASITPNDPTFAEIQFVQKRVGDAIEVTQQVNNAAGVDVKGHVNTILAKRILKTFTAQAFGFGTAEGSEATKFQSILDYNAQTPVTKKINSIDIKEFTGVTVANVDSAYGEYVEANSDEPVWIVDTFATANDLKDAVTGALLNKDKRANGGIGTIHGIQVYVQPMNAKAKMVLMNPKAYAVSVAKDIKMRDGLNEVNGKTTYVADVLAQGKVVDPNAIKIIKA